IGVGVKNSTSDMLVQRCNEFIYYDDLVRERKRPVKRAPRKSAAKSEKADKAARSQSDSPAQPAAAHSDASDHATEARDHDKKQEAFDLVLATIEALIAERGDDEKIWSSMVKQALKRRRPGFNESYYGFRSFNALLEEAASKRLLGLDREGKSGGYLVRLTPD